MSEVEYLVNKETGCWDWQLAKTTAGYGETWNGERPVYAHRVFYERVNGPIPVNKCIDHLCRNRACVNPDHLEVVTVAENNRRGDRAKLDWDKVREIRSAYKRGELQRVLAQRFGVAECSISHVVNHRTWVEGT